MPLSRLCRSNASSSSFELDPSKCSDASQRQQNLVAFKAGIRDLVTSICSPQAMAKFPVELKHLFWLVRRKVHQKGLSIKGLQADDDDGENKQQLKRAISNVSEFGGEDKLVRVYCVSAFVFLRLLCPAMISPKAFGLRFNMTGNGKTPKIANDWIDSTADGFDYLSLGTQFNVFSPSFMFDLQPSKFSCCCF